MLTFAFVVLSFVLAAVALYFAYMFYSQRLDTRLTELDAQLKTAIGEQNTTLTEHQVKIEQLTATVSRLSTQPLKQVHDLGGIRAPNQKMEDRYAELAKRTVIVDGVEVPTAAAG